MLLPDVLNWLATAEDCFRDEYGSLRRGLLSSVFALVTGMPRVFHLDQMEDLGFALLSGGWRCPSRYIVGAWRRHLTWYEVDSFCRRTSPWDGISGEEATVSFDEHSIPRWTRKFSIRKGYVTTRNKYMRCEKLYYGYDVVGDRFLTVRGTPGNVELRDVSLAMVRQVLKQGGPRRLHALYTTRHAEPPEVLGTFRTRQHHEQGYRVGVYDEFLNAVPCGYDKQSPNRQRPRFHRGPLQMIGWLVALVYNAIADLANHLPTYYHGMHVSTLRRTFFNRPGQLYCTPNTLIVYLDFFSEQEALIPLIDQINQQQYCIPWLDDRRLVLSLTPSNLPRPGP